MKEGRGDFNKAGMHRDGTSSSDAKKWVPQAIRVFGLFLVSFGTLGFQYAQGFFFATFLSVFRSSRAETSFISTITIGVLEGSGTLVGHMIVFSDERYTCLCGASLAGIALLLSALCQHLWQLYLCFGVLLGLAHSLSLLAAVVLVNKWFDKFKASAIGIGNMGAGVGTVVLGFLVPELEHGFGWRGCLMILAALDFALLAASSMLLTIPSQYPTPAVMEMNAVLDGISVEKAHYEGIFKTVTQTVAVKQFPFQKANVKCMCAWIWLLDSCNICTHVSHRS